MGEETVGGQNPTPDQSVVEEDGEAVGLTYQDNEPLGVDDKVGERDRDPWELNPASTPDFGERVNEEFNAPLENLGITPANKTGRKQRKEEKTQNQPTRSPRSRAPSATAMRVAGKGTAAARRAKGNRANTSRSAKSRSTGKRTAKGTSKSRRSAPARARGTRR